MFIWMYVSKSVSLWWFYVSESVRCYHCYVSKSVPCSVQRYPIAYRGKGRNKHKGHFAAQLSYGASWHISHTLFYAAIPPTKEHHKYAVIRSFPTLRFWIPPPLPTFEMLSPVRITYWFLSLNSCLFLQPSTDEVDDFLSGGFGEWENSCAVWTTLANIYM